MLPVKNSLVFAYIPSGLVYVLLTISSIARLLYHIGGAVPTTRALLTWTHPWTRTRTPSSASFHGYRPPRGLRAVARPAACCCRRTRYSILG
jgi:hypothetical protein